MAVNLHRMERFSDYNRGWIGILSRDPNTGTSTAFRERWISKITAQSDSLAMIQCGFRHRDGGEYSVWIWGLGPQELALTADLHS